MSAVYAESESGKAAGIERAESLGRESEKPAWSVENRNRNVKKSQFIYYFILI
jgi:uncharacterized protein YpmB